MSINYDINGKVNDSIFSRKLIILLRRKLKGITTLAEVKNFLASAIFI